MSPQGSALTEVVVISQPDGLLVRSWSRADRGDPEAAAAHAGQLIKVAQELAASLFASKEIEMISVEGADRRLVLAGVSSGLLALFAFERSAPLGLARMEARELVDRIRHALIAPAAPPPDAVTPAEGGTEDLPRQVPRGVSAIAAATTVPDAAVHNLGVPSPPPSSRARALEALELLRLRPGDFRAALIRVSLRSGIPVEALEEPTALDDVQLEAAGAAARDVLG
jgi:predicted regulator of Ras-like GTPase activity (Roadblock/LC7/MglB family)